MSCRVAWLFPNTLTLNFDFMVSSVFLELLSWTKQFRKLQMKILGTIRFIYILSLFPEICFHQTLSKQQYSKIEPYWYRIPHRTIHVSEHLNNFHLKIILNCLWQYSTAERMENYQRREQRHKCLGYRHVQRRLWRNYWQDARKGKAFVGLLQFAEWSYDDHHILGNLVGWHNNSEFNTADRCWSYRILLQVIAIGCVFLGFVKSSGNC